MKRLLFSLVIALSVGINAVDAHEPVSPQVRLNSMKWSWDKEKEATTYYLRDVPADMNASLEEVRLRFGDPRPVTRLTVEDGRAITYRVDIHSLTPFRIQDGRIYYARYSAISTGCMLLAVDLKSGKPIWKTNLKGCGQIEHSKYSNRVAFEVEKDVAIVHGNETSGQYIEIVDLATGKILANRQFNIQRRRSK